MCMGMSPLTASLREDNVWFLSTFVRTDVFILFVFSAMDSRQAMRDRTIVEWYFQDWIGDTSHLPEPEDVLTFMKIVVDVISMNRSLSEPERNYLIGRAAILGKQEARCLSPSPVPS